MIGSSYCEAEIAWHAAMLLQYLDCNNEIAINLFIHMLHSDKEIDRNSAVNSLIISELSKKNITKLKNKLNTELTDDIRVCIEYCLSQVSEDSQVYIYDLKKIFFKTEKEITKISVARYLNLLSTIDTKVISHLVDLILYREKKCDFLDSSEDINIISQRAADTLSDILKACTEKEVLKHILCKLAGYCWREIEQNNVSDYEACHRVIWECAKQLSYSEFFYVVSTSENF